MSRPTIYTIARQCGVSHATVSLALRNSSLVAEKTRKRIQAVADEVGFRPNRLALSLKTGKSRVIGFVLPNFTYPFYSLIAEYVFQEVSLLGYQVQFVLSGSDVNQESDAIVECMDARVDGVIIFSVIPTREKIPRGHALRMIQKKNIPCVTGNYVLGFPGVSLDHHQASLLATRHLLELGYEDIRLLQLGGDKGAPVIRHSASEQSIEGFRQALKEKGIKYDASMLMSRAIRHEEIVRTLPSGSDANRVMFIEYGQYEALGVEMAEQALAEKKGRMGIVFGHDAMACAVWRYCINKGIRIPQDVGLVGRGDILTYMMPLTTIGWDYKEQARRLVSLLVNDVDSSGKNEFVRLEPYLAVRESTG
ncbi:MAG: LacI family DNA-binding transcriptional regulator [Kiritimatiellales bacterium]